MNPLQLLYRAFDGLEWLLSTLSDRARAAWTGLQEGPLVHLVVFFILLVTGIQIVLSALLEELDRLLAWLEKAFIAVALLVMVGLSFADYLRREIPGFTLEIAGGAGMSVVLMVWVGFLGASLSTRQRKHLAVDATDRLLSPAAARLVKRFTALVAAGFCWLFTGHAAQLMEENLLQGTGQEALPLWDVLLPVVNLLGGILINPSPSLPLLFGLIGVLLALVYALRRAVVPAGAARSALEAAGALTLLATGLVLLSHLWQPIQADGSPMTWTPLGEPVEASSVAGDGTVAPADGGGGGTTNAQDILSLVGDDTGAPDAADGSGGPSAADAAAIAAFVEKNSDTVAFPMWLAQAVIPLSFLLMSLRFLGQGISGRFTSPEPDDEDDPEAGNVSSATPPTPTTVVLVPSTGKRGGASDLIVAGLFPGLLLGMGAVLGLKLGTLILLAAILLVLTGAPLFLAIGVASLACVTLIQDISALNIAKDMYESVKKEELLAIPFFVLAGNIMTQGSIAERLVGVARALMGRVSGGLGLATVFACVIFAAISGSSPVTVIAVGSIMFPMLVRERYPESYALGVLTSAGSLGIIIPPSVPMIIYAIVVGQTLLSVGKQMIDPQTGLLPGGLDPSVLQLSPNDLFIAGVLPGLFIAAMLAVYTLFVTRPGRKGVEIVEPRIEGSYLGNVLREVRRSWLSLLLPVLILGGIYGILGPLRFTVTEAAAVAVVYALVVELLIHRELKLRALPKVLYTSGVMMGGLFLIIVLAIAFNKFLAEQYIPQNAAAWIQSQVSSPWQFLLLANIFLLLLGCVMDIISAILIVAPLLAPIALSYGIHPLHFGIMFIVNLELGYLTPPLGINLFVSSTVFNRPIVQVIRASLPFMLLMLFCLVVIIGVPWLSLALVP